MHSYSNLIQKYQFNSVSYLRKSIKTSLEKYIGQHIIIVLIVKDSDKVTIEIQ